MGRDSFLCTTRPRRHLICSVNGHRVKKRRGSSKSVAELALKDIEVKIAKNELGFLPKDSDFQKLFQEFLKYSKTNLHKLPLNATKLS